MRTSFRHHRGFTLIELIVVIAILAVLAMVAYPLIGKMGAGDVSTCRSNLEALGNLGKTYSQDMASKRKGKILPTSGMGDDLTTKTFNENDGWWVELSRVDESAVRPTKKGVPLKVSQFFHCGADKRAEVDNGVFEATPETISYVSWTDGSQTRSNPNSAILTTASSDLDNLPWLSDGTPVKGKSVINPKTFEEMVMPAIGRHENTILVLYASGIIKPFQVDEDADPAALFQRMAPSLKNKKTTGKKASKRAVSDEPEDYVPTDPDAE